MNTGMTITCDMCDMDVDCRIGYSNRNVQPLTFSCPHCESPIGITLDISDKAESLFNFHDCKPSKTQPKGPFDGSNPFLDLHLDFPVRSSKYKPGRTPFMMAMEDLKTASEGNDDRATAMMGFHRHRLDALNDMYEQASYIKRLINLYLGKNKQLFQKKAAAFLGKEENTSLLPQDINATLYSVIAVAFSPFTVFEQSKEISQGMPHVLQKTNRERLNVFIDELDSSSFLTHLQKDCLKIYPRIFDAELPIRPALFLDFTGSCEAEKVATKVSVQDFVILKDLYRDIVEILGRKLVLVAGINNLLYRDSHDTFELVDGGRLSNLNRYSAKPLSDKFKYLDNSWYKVDTQAYDVELRNSIAHNNVQFDGREQIITYSPEGGRLEQPSTKTISFLQFARLLLLAFREMHNLHHVVKTLFYYKYLIRDKSEHD